MNWRENFLTTTSAQLAVIPLLLANFGNFSLLSLPANILVLEAIPIIMIMGFALAALEFIALPLAAVYGWFVSLFLAYELKIIDIFSGISLPIGNNMGILSAIIYYLAIITFVLYFQFFRVKYQNA